MAASAVSTLRGMAHTLEANSYVDFKSRLINSNCSKCPDLCSGRNRIVVDRGNPKTDLVAIGEAPGANEDLKGQAFVGRAGQLLDKLMLSIGIDTNQQMLIINVVKCRPPNNRPPKPEEAKNCMPYLEWQLNYVKPKVVLLFGATAAKHLMPEAKKIGMKERVGKFFDVAKYPGMKFQLHYHPAYLLRDPRKKPETLSHLQDLKRFLAAQ